MELSTTINIEVNIDCKQILTGGLIWGLVRTVVLEIDSRMISIVCIYTNYLLSEKDMIAQVGYESLVDG